MSDLTSCPDDDPACEACNPLVYTPSHRGQSAASTEETRSIFRGPTGYHREA